MSPPTLRPALFVLTLCDKEEMIPNNGVFVQLEQQKIISGDGDQYVNGPYQGNEFFFGIFLLREVSQEQCLDVRRRERVLLRNAGHGVGNRREGFFLGHCDVRQYRLFL